MHLTFFQMTKYVVIIALFLCKILLVSLKGEWVCVTKESIFIFYLLIIVTLSQLQSLPQMIWFSSSLILSTCECCFGAVAFFSASRQQMHMPHCFDAWFGRCAVVH